MRDIIIRGYHLKMVAYLIILAVLAGIILIQYFYPMCPECPCEVIKGPSAEELSGMSVLEVSQAPLESEVELAEEEAVEEVPEETAKELLAKEEPPLELTGEIGFSVDEVSYDIKGDDWAKVTAVKYTIDNGDKDFTPLIKLFLFDENDEETIKNYVEEEITLPKLKAGYSLTRETDVDVSYSDIDLEKTLKLMLYDENGNELATAIKKFTTN